MSSKKTGCPGCGKPTSGTPTDKGFLWATCDDCLKKVEAKEPGSSPPAENKPSADFSAKKRPGNKTKGK